MNKGYTNAAIVFAFVIVASSLALLSTNAFSQPTYTANDFFTNLIYNEAGLGHGVAVFELRNPLATDIVADTTNLKSRIAETKGASPTYNTRYYIEETTISITNITDYSTACSQPNITNNSFVKCAYQPIGWHLLSRTSNYWKPFSSYTFKAGQTYRVKLEAEWSPKQGFNSREWFPQFVYSGNTYEQLKWDWWNSTYGYRYIVTNLTGSNLAISANGTNGIGSGIVWCNARGPSDYIYSIASGPSGSVACANETHELYWENETSRVGNSPSGAFPSTAGVWHMRNESGTVYDSRYGNNTPNTGGQNVAGVFGNGLHFKRSESDVLDFGSSVTYATGPWSFSVWFNATSPASAGTDANSPQGILGGPYDITGTFTIGGGVTQQLCFVTQPSGGWTCAAQPLIQANTLYHAVITFDGTSVAKLYVNGNLTVTKTGINDNNMAFRYIGRGFNAANYFDGVIDEARVYTAELSQAEVQALYDNGRNLLGLLGDGEESASESSAREAIESAIRSSLGSVPIYTDQLIYIRNSTNYQQLARFDKVAKYRNQIWAFNHFNGAASYASMPNITPSFYTLELKNLQVSQITSSVSSFINSTRR